MKTKNILYLTYSILGGLLFYSLFIDKTLQRMNFNEQFEQGLRFLKANFGLDANESRILEQLYRNETNHFRSGQFKRSLSPGMERHGDKYPYGWSTLKRVLWDENPTFKPIGFVTMKENETGIPKTFLKFNDVTSGMAAVLLHSRNYYNNGGFYRWYSTNPERQEVYKNRLDNLRYPITKKVFNI